MTTDQPTIDPLAVAFFAALVTEAKAHRDPCEWIHDVLLDLMLEAG